MHLDLIKNKKNGDLNNVLGSITPISKTKIFNKQAAVYIKLFTTTVFVVLILSFSSYIRI